MSKIILITGGARSGKTDLGLKMAEELGGENVLYIATATAWDNEMKERIKHHKKSRPQNWNTFEGYLDISKNVCEWGKENKVILLDCITMMVNNLFFHFYENSQENINYENWVFEDLVGEKLEILEEKIHEQIEKLIDEVRKQDITFIMVTNEVGMGVVPGNKLARVFRDIYGRMNTIVAKTVDEVYLCVSGIPVKIK